MNEANKKINDPRGIKGMDNIFEDMRKDSRKNVKTAQETKAKTESQSLSNATQPEEQKQPISQAQQLNNNILALNGTIQEFLRHYSEELDAGSIPKGKITNNRYTNYYDRHFTIGTTGIKDGFGAADPNDFEANLYQVVKVYEELNQRYANIINVANFGTDLVFAVVSHGGRTNFSKEEPIFPGEVKKYYWVYELRFRSATSGVVYQVSEYDLDTSCCPSNSIVTPTGAIVPQPNWLNAAEVIAPIAGASLVSKTVSAGKTGFIFGFWITSQETNDYKINWTSGGVVQSLRISIGAKGTTSETNKIPFNENLPADAGTTVTITNIAIGSLTAVYQALLLYAEA